MPSLSKTIFIFIFLALPQIWLAQHCLTEQEYKLFKQSPQKMKEYVNQVAMHITSAQFNEAFPRFVKKLGKGSFGVVSLYTTKRGNQAALKQIQKVPINKQGTMGFDYEALFKEINANSCMVELINENPEFSNNFVVLTGVYFVNSNEYILSMKYYASTLDTFQKNSIQSAYGYLDHSKQKLVDKIMLSLAEGLQFMHSKNLSHRDLKLENVMMDGNSPLIMDFGLTTPEANLFGTIAGTPYFIDPNLLKSGKGGKETDVYALGIMYYLLLNGLSSYKTLENMLIQGGWGQKNRVYSPNLASLSFPTKYKTLKGMISSSSRMTIDEVVDELKTIQGLKKLDNIELRYFGGNNQLQPIVEKPEYHRDQKYQKQAVPSSTPQNVKRNVHMPQKFEAPKDNVVKNYHYNEKAQMQQKKYAIIDSNIPSKPSNIGLYQDADQYKRAQYQEPNSRAQMNAMDYVPRAQDQFQYKKKQNVSDIAEYRMDQNGKINAKYLYPDHIPDSRNQRGMPVERVVPPKHMNEMQRESHRVQNLAMQNKLRHQQDNNIFGHKQYRIRLI